MGGILGNALPMAGGAASGFLQGQQQRDTHDMIRQQMAGMAQQQQQSAQRFPLQMSQLQGQNELLTNKNTQYGPTGFQFADFMKGLYPGMNFDPNQQYNRTLQEGQFAQAAAGNQARLDAAHRPTGGGSGFDHRMSVYNTLVGKSKTLEGILAKPGTPEELVLDPEGLPKRRADLQGELDGTYMQMDQLAPQLGLPLSGHKQGGGKDAWKQQFESDVADAIKKAGLGDLDASQ